MILIQSGCGKSGLEPFLRDVVSLNKPGFHSASCVPSAHPCGLPKESINFMFYKEHKKKNFAVFLINREVVQLAILELHPLNIKLWLL